MNYFVVFQNQTYKEEKKGQYLWAPQRNKTGRTQFYWESMKDARPGDIVFSMYNQHLQSVNRVTQAAIESENPFAGNELLGRRGWLVKVDYHELKNPVFLKPYAKELIELSPAKYGPFTRNGSGNQGYLYPIEQDLGDFLMGLAKNHNEVNSYIPYQLNKEEKELIASTEQLIERVIESTEKQRIIKARIGQGLFKTKLLERTKNCEICGLDIPALLIASHCKPWSRSTHNERLDPNNGLLLCANHDAVFDKGFISFEADGTIIISERLEPKNYELLGLNRDIKVTIGAPQTEYIKWHRNEVYLKE